jgi:hypothetical protein
LTSRKRLLLPCPNGGTQPSKVSRLYVIKPDFDVIYADFLLRLCSSYYLLYGVDEGGLPVIRIQDCSYNKRVADSKGVNFVPKSVKFTPQQWSDLLAAADDIADVLQGECESDGDQRVHIGSNTFITVKPDREIIDIREFFLPKDNTVKVQVNNPESYYNIIYPTKRGVQLSRAGWSVLISKGADMMSDLACGKLSGVNQSCFSRHTDPVVDVRKCSHCNPNGFSLG